MKTKLLYLILLMFGISQAQIELVPNPCDINSGTITFKYGEFADYSIFDPMSDPNLYLYTGLQTDADPMTWDYHDDFANLSTMIPLTFDSGLGYYVATFNPATRTYLEEPILNTTTIPNGTEVFDWYFLITNADQSRQSADLRGSDYGFGSAILSVETFTITKNITVGNGTITFKSPAQYSIVVYDVLGKKVIDDTLNIATQTTHDFQLQSTGVYLVKINSDNFSRTVKMVKY
ncbi:T9SS type A sorting domain-containing protein [uncultured Winogradskyella sp.]|uniref:T9SS type A sorting domain-containing protein n=1 Tax=uncultured Winogradskyella sp. TaxID=395353 RepID=UPI002624A0A9|nr:T9SS type A sorting domain-containing protein [uncultured Winogradskyella sp.]